MLIVKKHVFFEAYIHNLQQIILAKTNVSCEKRADNSTPLQVSSRPLILLRHLRRVFAYVYVYTYIQAHFVDTTYLETCASKGNRSTTLNDSDDNLPAPHLPRLPLFIDAVGRSRREKKLKRTCV